MESKKKDLEATNREHVGAFAENEDVMEWDDKYD